MNGKLTVKDVAKLLNISAHTIRYYDKEGLLTKEQDEKNGYRLFSLDDVTRLSNVMILRESGISIKSIKALIEDYSTKKYRDCLKESLERLDKEEARIKESKERILQTLKSLQHKDKSMNRCDYPDRYLHEITRMTYSDAYNQKLVEAFKGLTSYSIIHNDLVYTLCEDKMIVSFESHDESDLKVDGGEYLNYHLTIAKNEDIDVAIGDVLAYAERNNIVLDAQVYLSMSPHAMLVTDGGYIARLSCKIIDG